MPRTVEEILDQADQLAERFEGHEPDPDAIRDAAALRDVRHAFLARAETERQLSEAVAAARAEGHSWSSIGAMVGTSGEAARQRYGRAAKQAAMISRFRESGVKPGPLERRSRD